MKDKTKILCNTRWMILLVLAVLFLSTAAHAVYDYRFDDCTLIGPTAYPQTWNALNWPSANGHVIIIGGEGKWDAVKANGNFIACYYNTLNDPGYLQRTATQKADDIRAYLVSMFPTKGVPKWLFVNEISAGLWPDNQTYRTWVINVCARLKNTYNHNVVICAPFQNPGQNNADWQALANVAYIGDECYLSGQEIKASGYSQSWCQTQYQASMNSYLNRGVPWSKLLLLEHWAWSSSSDGWGRAALYPDEWNLAIARRDAAARAVGFVGYVGYAWGNFNSDYFTPQYFDANQAPFASLYSTHTLP